MEQKVRRGDTDKMIMSSISNIASASSTLSQLQVQNQVSMKVLKMAQNEGKGTADMVSKSMEDLQESISNVAESLSEGVDSYA